MLFATHANNIPCHILVCILLHNTVPHSIYRTTPEHGTILAFSVLYLSTDLSTDAGMRLAMCAQAHFVYVLALRCYKMLQKEVNKRLHNVCYALYYTHTNNAPKETQHANHPAL